MKEFAQEYESITEPTGWYHYMELLLITNTESYMIM